MGFEKKAEPMVMDSYYDLKAFSGLLTVDNFFNAVVGVPAENCPPYARVRVLHQPAYTRSSSEQCCQS
jgi:hypothetical protein